MSAQALEEENAASRPGFKSSNVVAAYEKGRHAPWLQPRPVSLDWRRAIVDLAHEYRVQGDKKKLGISLEHLKKSLSGILIDCVTGNGWDVWFGWYAVICIQATFKRARHDWSTDVVWNHGVELFNLLVDERVDSHGADALSILACFASKSPSTALIFIAKTTRRQIQGGRGPL